MNPVELRGRQKRAVRYRPMASAHGMLPVPSPMGTGFLGPFGLLKYSVLTLTARGMAMSASVWTLSPLSIFWFVSFVVQVLLEAIMGLGMELL